MKIIIKPLKPIFYYSVMTGNRGDMAIRKSIVDAISKKINVPFVFLNVKYEELTEQRIVNQLNIEGSCLIIAGSGLYTNYNTSSGWYFPCKTELFKKIKVPIILLGIGCNNNLGEDIFKGELKLETKQSIKLINNLATISTVRDLRTYDLLSNLGIKNHKLLLDPANFLEVPEVKKEKKVAINLAQHSPALGRFDGTKNLRNYNINVFARVSRHLINLGYKIIFIAHDALEQSLIIDLKKYIPELEWLNTDDLDKMLCEYARCQFSIGIKMHSNIMSFASGIPFISLYYDVKSIEYMKLIDWDLGINVFTNYFSNLIKFINELIDKNEYYTFKIKRIKERGQMKFDKIINEICNIIINQYLNKSEEKINV